MSRLMLANRGRTEEPCNVSPHVSLSYCVAPRTTHHRLQGLSESHVMWLRRQYTQACPTFLFFGSLLPCDDLVCDESASSLDCKSLVLAVGPLRLGPASS